MLAPYSRPLGEVMAGLAPLDPPVARCPKCYYFPHIIQRAIIHDSDCHALKHQAQSPKSFQLHFGMSTYHSYILVPILSDILLS